MGDRRKSEVMELFDADDVSYSYGSWDAQASAEEQNAAAEELIAQGYTANMIRFHFLRCILDKKHRGADRNAGVSGD